MNQARIPPIAHRHLRCGLDGPLPAATPLTATAGICFAPPPK